MTNEDLRKELSSKPYAWGKFVCFHEVGEYLVVEYKPKGDYEK